MKVFASGWSGKVPRKLLWPESVAVQELAGKHHRPPSFCKKKMEFQVPTSNGFSLAARIDPCISDTKGILILCHGLLNTQDSHVCRSLAGQLNSVVHVCRFDFRGNGNSGGETSYGNYADEMEDVQSVVSYVNKEFRSRFGPVLGVVGHSKAASVVLMHAETYAAGWVELYRSQKWLPVDFRWIAVALSGRFDMKVTPSSRFTMEQMHQLTTQGSFVWRQYALRGNQVDYIIRQEDLDRRSALDMKPTAAHVGKLLDRGMVKVLVVHGDADQVIPVADAHAYIQELGPNNCKLRVLQGVDHFYRRDKDIAEIAQEIRKLVFE